MKALVTGLIEWNIYHNVSILASDTLANVLSQPLNKYAANLYCLLFSNVNVIYWLSPAFFIENWFPFLRHSMISPYLTSIPSDFLSKSGLLDAATSIRNILEYYIYLNKQSTFHDLIHRYINQKNQFLLFFRNQLYQFQCSKIKKRILQFTQYHNKS